MIQRTIPGHNLCILATFDSYVSLLEGICEYRKNIWTYSEIWHISFHLPHLLLSHNGPGSSIRLPTEGSIWKAQGLRLAYVAQHAFHHLEKHMQETPTAYIMWRFAGNDDRDLEF